MSYNIALLTSAMTHNARMLAGSPDRYVNGVAVVRVGDPVHCPTHGVNQLTNSGISQQTDTKQVAHVGATAACGAMIVTGSADVNVG